MRIKIVNSVIFFTFLAGFYPAPAAMVILQPNQNTYSTSAIRRIFRSGGNEVSQGYLLIYFQRYQNRFIGTVPFSDMYPRLGLTLGINGMDGSVYKQLFGTDSGKTLTFDYRVNPRSLRGTGSEFSNIQISNAPIPMDGISQIQFKMLISSYPVDQKTPLETGVGEANTILKMVPVPAVQGALTAGMTFYNVLDPSIETLFGLNTENNRVEETFGLSLAGPTDADNPNSTLGNGSILVYDDKRIINWDNAAAVLSLANPASKWSFDGSLKLGGQKVPLNDDTTYWLLRLEYVDSVVVNGDELVGNYGDYATLLKHSTDNVNKLSCYDSFQKIDTKDCLHGSPADLDDIKERLTAAETNFKATNTALDSINLLTKSDRAKLKLYYQTKYNGLLDKMIKPRDYTFYLAMVPQRYSVAEDIVDISSIDSRIQANPNGFWGKLSAKLDQTPRPTTTH